MAVVGLPGRFAAGGSRAALRCAAFYTLFETSYRAQVHRQPGGQLPGELVYIGPGCKAQREPTGVLPEDPYLADPRGKIALVPEANSFFPTPGMPREREDGRGALVGEVLIPEVTIKKPDGDALRAVLCPTVVGGQCSGGRKVTGAMVDLPGEWGGLRILDTTNPAAPAEVATYRPEVARAMPPPDHRGIYSVHHAVTEGSRAYAAWNSAGLRVLDLTDPVAPLEVASFVPPRHHRSHRHCSAQGVRHRCGNHGSSCGHHRHQLRPVGAHQAGAGGQFRLLVGDGGWRCLRVRWRAVPRLGGRLGGRRGALLKPGGRAGWLGESWRVLLVSLVALPIVVPPAIVILLALAVFFLLELLLWVPLRVAAMTRQRRRQPTKEVNLPDFNLRLG